MTATPAQLGLLHLVPFDRHDPRPGFTTAVELIRYAEELGFDSAWLRTRHLQYGVPAPAVLFGALAQATRRIALGTAVIPLEYENPFRLAEDLATADVLSGGRVHAGLSVHPPRLAPEVAGEVFEAGWRDADFSYARIERLRRFLAGSPVRRVPEYSGIGGDIDSERVEPHSPGLADRLWYGGGSLRSAEWAGSAGLGLLLSNIATSNTGELRDFGANQAEQIARYRAAWRQAGRAGSGRVALARVVVPTDGTAAAQRARYRDYVTGRTARTRRVHGAGTIVAPDLTGSTPQILDALAQDRAAQAADDLIFELPFELGAADWRHHLEQLATRIGPALGWRPAG